MKKAFTTIEFVFILVIVTMAIGTMYPKYVEYKKNQAIIEYTEKDK